MNIHECLTSAECRMTSKGAEYRGSQTHTVSYRSCQRWDFQTPHGHTFRHGWMFADGNTTAAGNQCRNPGGVRDRPWCMTNDPAVTWEYCNVPLCGETIRAYTQTTMLNFVSLGHCMRPYIHAYLPNYLIVKQCIDQKT